MMKMPDWRSAKQRDIQCAVSHVTMAVSLSTNVHRFQRSQRESDPSVEDDFERYCSEAMFRIQVLERRLASHQEGALRKFQDLDAKLRGMAARAQSVVNALVIS